MNLISITLPTKANYRDENKGIVSDSKKYTDIYNGSPAHLIPSNPI